MHSTRTMLSTYSQLIKNKLLRPLEETVGPLTNKQQLLITALEVIRIEDFISSRIGVGRPTIVDPKNETVEELAKFNEWNNFLGC